MLRDDPQPHVEFQPDTVIGTEGHYRVGQATDGHWWLLDPTGRPFVYRGVCAVNRAGTAGGRYAKPGPYAETCRRIYGDDDDAFVASCLGRVADCGLNALGAWTTEEFFERGVCYTEILELRWLRPECTLKGKGIYLPDVFDPAWEEAIEQGCRRLCTTLRNSRDLLGYFTDNEMGWGQPGTDHVWGGGDDLNTTEGVPTLLQFCLSLPADRPACRAAWRFLQERHGSIAAIAAAWGVHLAGPDDLREITSQGLVIDSAAYGEDLAAFTELFAERYFRLSAEAIRRHDPNHLILGCRFGGPPTDAVFAACRRPWVDVLSANNYRDNFYERVDVYYRATGLPILNGEFAWASGYFTEQPLGRTDDRQAPGEQGDGLTPRQRVLVKGPEALERAFTHPGLVGYTWYRWVHSFEEPEDITYGLVNRSGDELNRLNRDMLRRCNGRLAMIKAGQAEPVKFADRLIST